MMRSLSLLAIAGLACLAGCVSQSSATPPANGASSGQPQQAAQAVLAERGLAPAVSVIPESGIGPQTLESRECALFLWSKTDPSQFIFFQRAASGSARMRLAAETVEVVQTGNRGQVFGQFMTEQSFLAPGGETVEVSFQPGEELQGGQRVEEGRLTITSGDRWRTVIPVLGVRACRP